MHKTIKLLTELNRGHFPDELAAAIMEASAATKIHGKAAKVKITLEIESGAKETELEEHPVTIRTKIDITKPKKPHPNIMFLDEDDHPTRDMRPRRQEGLKLAGEEDNGTGGKKH